MMMSDPSTQDLVLELRRRYTQAELAQKMGSTLRTVRRWESGESMGKDYLRVSLRHLLNASTKAGDFTFADVFAGIGGTRLAFEDVEGVKGRCVFTAEWNKFAVQTYCENFGHDDEHVFAEDITKVAAQDVPDHDVLLAGFPCQPFSIAGVSKKNSLGRAHGFQDATQGTLFFDVARIIDEKRPQAFLLENVKNLLSHDGGNTFRVIERTLKEELDYHVQCRVIDARAFVPQGRKRIIIVGFREENSFDFGDLMLPDYGPTLGETVLHPENGSELTEEPYTTGDLARVNDKYTLTPKLWQYLQNYAIKHRAAGNGFGFGLVDRDDVARTLSARYHKDGSEILVSRGEGETPRRLTPRECARLMGFPDDYRMPVSDTQAYRQFGNSVVVPAIAAVARLMIPHLKPATS